jgi:hypothetical protein
MHLPVDEHGLCLDPRTSTNDLHSSTSSAANVPLKPVPLPLRPSVWNLIYAFLVLDNFTSNVELETLHILWTRALVAVNPAYTSMLSPHEGEKESKLMFSIVILRLNPLGTCITHPHVVLSG